MSNKVIVITGGSRGIGAATARMASQQGWDVCISYVSNSEAAEAVVRDLQAQGVKALAHRCDVAVEADVIDLFKAVDQHFGRVDALVNSAGITGKLQPAQEREVADIEHVLRTNVLGTIVCVREAVKRMSRQSGGRGGAIVNLSSVASRLGGPPMMGLYAASKGAIDSFTRGVAREVAEQGIRVNQVSPGVIATDMNPPARRVAMASLIPLGRAGEADEVASAILWLASDASSYVTATNIDVTGGR